MIIGSLGLVRLLRFEWEFSFLIYLLFLMLVLAFLSNNLIGFYFYFEASLIPTFLIIIGYGYQPERIQAGIYFIFYTLIGSLPLLILIIYYYSEVGRLSIGVYLKGMEVEFYSLGGLILVGAFLVKMPIYVVHL